MENVGASATAASNGDGDEKSGNDDADNADNANGTGDKGADTDGKGDAKKDAATKKGDDRFVLHVLFLMGGFLS